MFNSKRLIAVMAGLVIPFSALQAGGESSKSKEQMQPRVALYQMPNSLPLKAELDAFFQQKRWIFSEQTMKQAGFSSWSPRKFSRVIVSNHPHFPGYIFKAYLDVQEFYNFVPESEIWALRAEGAAMIQQEIEAQGWEAYMKVPKKWIYVLPRNPKPPKGYQTKHSILVQDDMELLSTEENNKKWKSNEVTFDDLSRVYHILKKFGLSDCAKVHNIPFAKDGRIAFIDTQTHGDDEVTWDCLDKMLSVENKAFWQALRKNK